MAQRIKFGMIILLVIMGMSACGQKGDLYLPDRDQASLVNPKKPA